MTSVLSEDTSLFWWIDTFRLTDDRRRYGRGAYYVWHVRGRIEDVQYPEFLSNGREYSWTVPNLRTSGGRYVFALRPV